MARSMLVCGVLVVLAGALAGCGEYHPPRADPDAGVDGPPDAAHCDARPDELDLPAFGRDLYSALCSSTVRCDLFSTFRDKAECVAFFDRYYDGVQTKFLRGLDDALRHGLLSVDRQVMARCFAALESGACPVSLDSAACHGLFTGARPPGATCFSDQECAAPGSFCAGLDAERACKSGVCSQAAALGQGCSAEVRCAPGAHCVARPSGGAVCESGDLGARCGDSGDCDRELRCEQGACVADRAIGQPCRLDGECGSGSLCVGELSSGTGSGVCSKVTAVGDTCDDYCFGSLYCEVPQLGQNGSCAALPKQGEPCFTSLGRCGGVELTCSNQDRCVPLPGEGEACEAGTFCKAGFFCSTELSANRTGSCVALGAVGAACSRDGNCQSYDCGDDGKCRQWTTCHGAAPSEPCPR